MKFKWQRPNLKKQTKPEEKTLFHIEINAPLNLDKDFTKAMASSLCFFWQKGKCVTPWILSPLATVLVLVQVIGGNATEGSSCLKQLPYGPYAVSFTTEEINPR